MQNWILSKTTNLLHSINQESKGYSIHVPVNYRNYRRNMNFRSKNVFKRILIHPLKIQLITTISYKKRKYSVSFVFSCSFISAENFFLKQKKRIQFEKCNFIHFLHLLGFTLVDFNHYQSRSYYINFFVISYFYDVRSLNINL